MSLLEVHNKVGEEAFPDHLLQSAQIITEENVKLFDAALHGRKGELLSILQNSSNEGKVNPNFFHRPEDHKNALHVAAEMGHIDCVQALLEHGSVVDAVAISKQDTALILASHSDRPDVVKLLLDHHANPNAANGYGNTALHEACHAGLLNVSKLLVAAGANVAAANKKGSTPLHTLSYGADTSLPYEELVDVLIQASETQKDQAGNVIGAKHYVNMPDKRGATPLLVCCTSGRLEIIKRLIHYGANLTAHDEKGQDAKAVALFYGQQEVLEYLESLSVVRSHRPSLVEKK
mmetsp:Transcript_21874/g.30086  ORF Transcript_21874/g.30086 Transcript_21874/m.30086 type:complete len:291 (+) Transcript_21874:39-911(+)|eukprot:CAMPEP_0170119248 /NCGR_PEP_ID=MMETSP0020_2-20130122/14265_1 /TAXON_ID=98059 /ORGANISM="Dinobryon sp., Strain UTEXLB2267" /LENGTH=290 /DNA_ID=CAMNT_0010348547 /DNA_START=49 /DNA_END=921 /DNA_ORIENTATION=+